jgi:protein-L-isoaspartate(D-aspartate) O-methyltransferase
VSNLDFDELRRRMVEEQLVRRGITNEAVLQAIGRIPRERFVPAALQAAAYDDGALPIDCEQTISQPYIVALMTEFLELDGHERVLDVGTGSGYQAAVLAELAAEVVTIERHPALARQAAERVNALGYRNVQFVHGDGTLGWPERAPYDGILVAAATDEIPPALLEQLAEGGRLVIPLGPSDTQVLYQYRHRGGQLFPRQLSGCRFVPLIAD